MAKIKLAEALLRRKELQEKVDQLKKINIEGLFETKVDTQYVKSQTQDEVVAQIAAKIPKISMQQVTHAYDNAAKNLRKIDAAIQRANWETEIEIDATVMDDYIDPYVKDSGE